MANFTIDTKADLGVDVYASVIKAEYSLKPGDEYGCDEGEAKCLSLTLSYDYLHCCLDDYYEGGDEERSETESFLIVIWDNEVRRVFKYDLSSPKAIQEGWKDNFSSNIGQFYFDWAQPIEPQIVEFIKENMATESNHDESVYSLLGYLHGFYTYG